MTDPACDRPRVAKINPFRLNFPPKPDANLAMGDEVHSYLLKKTATLLKRKQKDLLSM